MKRSIIAWIMAVSVIMPTLGVPVYAAEDASAAEAAVEAAAEEPEAAEAAPTDMPEETLPESIALEEAAAEPEIEPVSEDYDVELMATVASGDCGNNGNNVVWTLDSNGTLNIMGSGDMANYTTPSSVPWRYQRGSIKTVIIGNGVTSIGKCAFYDCYRLTSVSIPNSVTSIGNYAFYDCYRLASISVPNSVTSIGEATFAGCDELTNITVEAGNRYYCSVDGVLFDESQTAILQYPAGKTDSSYSIPNGVTSIGEYAFYDCDRLTSVSIPNSVTSIGESAFSSCDSLTNVSIPNGVTSIGYETFYDCDSLTSVSIPNSVTSIGRYAFAYCGSLTSVSIPNSVTSIGDFAFCACDSLSDVYYIGRSTQWSNISIGSYNACLTDAERHYLLDDTIFTTSMHATDSWNHTYGGEYHYWEFTSSTTGTYVFESTLSSGDSYGYVYDSKFNQLKYNDDGGDDSNFLITFDAEAGKTYYLATRWYSGSKTGNIPVKLSRRYTIRYDANGGSGAPAPQYKKYGETLTLTSTEPSRPGCTFMGWSTSKSASSASYYGGGSFSSNGDYTLYAVWYVPTYTISYNANGGSGAPQAQTKKYGESITLSTSVPTRTGYTFVGWEKSNSSSSRYYPGDTYTLNETCTLNALWEAAEDISTATQRTATARIPCRSSVRMFAFTPSESGTYVFESTGSYDTYGYVYSSSGAELESDDDGGSSTNFSITFTATKNTTYYLGAKFLNSSTTGSFGVKVTRQYTVNYSANGGSGAPQAQTKLYGETITLRSGTPYWSGYNFVGWAETSGASSAQYTPGSNFSLNRDCTLYAVWSRIPLADSPLISVEDGAGSKVIRMSSSTAGAKIYYTTNGSAPTSGSAQYTSPLTITSEGSVTYKAIAIADGYQDSAVTERTVTLERAAEPGASIPSGAVASGTKLTLTSSIPTAKIYYTTDGSSPSESSTQYTSDITINPPMTVKAIAIANGYLTSPVAEFSYTPMKAQPPSINEGNIIGGKSVQIVSQLEDADIYYTTNGSNPTKSSEKYSKEITFMSPGTYNVKAIAVRSGYVDSDIASHTVTVAAASAPVSNVGSGSVAKGTSVALSSDTAGAAIYYTTDGNDPSMSSNAYSEPISLNGSTVIKAIAVAGGYAQSSVSTFSYTVPTAERPSITVSDISGGKQVAITTATDGADIYYTADGTAPEHTSEKYTSPINFTSPGEYEIRAIAARDGYIDSEAAQLSVSVTKVEAPVSSQPSGTSVISGTSVTLTSKTPGATVYYTTDGSDPDENGLTEQPIIITESVNIKAVAIKNGCVNSDIQSFDYTLAGAAAAPSIVIQNITGGKSITMSSITLGARIYYTLDSTTPTVNSNEYTGPISITTPGTKIIKAIAVADGLSESIASSDTVMVEKLSAPRITPEQGRVPVGTSVSMSAADGASDIYYTTDGEEPTAESTRYTEPLILDSSMTIRAIAVGNGSVNSDEVTAKYDVYEKCAAPVITVTENQGVKTAELSCETDGAEIYYTTDGKTPSASGTRYTKPVVFDTPVNCEIKAIAVKNGYDDSDVSSKEITVTKTNAPHPSVNSGVVKKGTEIEFTGDGTIYYTINGGQEQIYTGSIIIEENTVIRVYAVSAGSLKSDTEQYTYTVEKITSGTEGSVTWIFNNNTLYVTGAGAIPEFEAESTPWYPLKDDIQKIIIGGTINIIGKNAFYGLSKVESVEFADTVVQINDSAFEGCTSLSEINLPSGMTSGIGAGAFKDCVSLNAITVPDTVPSISAGAFEGCSALTEITLPFVGSQEGSANNIDTFGYIFNGNVPDSLIKVTITNETNIPENAFKGLAHIQNVTVNDGVSVIGSGAFDGCSALKEFIIPAGVKTIGDNTFRGCAAATQITVPDSVQSIGEAAFDGCAKLTAVNIPFGVKYLYNYAFRNCASLTDIVIPNSVLNIEQSVLAGCNNLRTIKIPFVGANADPGSKTVTDEGKFGYLFGETDNSKIPAMVTKVTITSTDRSSYIPKEAFKNCGNIADIIVDGGRAVLDRAFENCKNLKNVYLPKSISNIGLNIFEGCTRIETLTIPFVGTNREDKNTATSVLGAFFGYDDEDMALGTLQYYNNDEDMHYYKIPKTLKNVTILAQTDIPTGALMNCDFVEKVSIVTGASMGARAFYNCVSLKSVTLPNDLQTISDKAFAECENLETINIPTKVKTIGSQVFYNARNLKNVTIPDSVQEIAEDVFNGTNLYGENIERLADGVITCSEGSYAQQYADANGIATNIVPSSKLDVKKTSTTVAHLSDNSYLFDVTDSHNMRGILHIELYSDSGLETEKTHDANDVEYRVEFADTEMKNITSAKIYVTSADGIAVSTEDEWISADGGILPSYPESDIEMTYHNGTIRLSGTTAVTPGAKLIQAVYNDDKTLNHVNIYPVMDVSEPITVEGEFKTGTAKFMLWSGMDGMRPLADAITE